MTRAATRAGDGPRRRSAGPRKRGAPIAAIDLGTNNCRLLIAHASGDGFQVVDSFSRAVRLGEGVAESGVLAASAMGRAVDALRICADKVRRQRARRVRAVATEACRRAQNGAAFIERVRATTGLRMDIITPEEEARLAVAGCAGLHDARSDQLMVVDIGGGSTELIWVDLAGTPPHLRSRLLMALAPAGRGRMDADDRARAAAAHIVDWVSAPVGVATLHEEFGGVADARLRFEAMSAAFEAQLAGFSPYDKRPKLSADFQIIGASGTVTTLAGAHLGLRRYDRSKVDGMWFPIDGAEAIIDEMVSLDDASRARHPGIGPDRSLLIVAGCAILATILRLWPTQRLRVADRGLREGLLYGLIAEGARADLEAPR